MKLICFRLKKSVFFGVLCFVLSGILVFMCSLGEKTVQTLAKKRALPVYSVDRNDNKIAISFDCAWGVEHTDEILSILDEYSVKCTFFAVQFWVETYPEYAKKIVEKGHELGTHSKTHPKMSTLTETKIKDELLSSANAILSATGVYPTLFRPPFGDYNDKVITTAFSLNLTPIQWSVDSLDWKDLTEKEIENRVIKRTKSGSIILCHNNGKNTAKALPNILKGLIDKGYTFVPIGELIYKDNYTIDGTGKQKTI